MHVSVNRTTLEALIPARHVIRSVTNVLQMPLTVVPNATQMHHWMVLHLPHVHVILPSQETEMYAFKLYATQHVVHALTLLQTTASHVKLVLRCNQMDLVYAMMVNLVLQTTARIVTNLVKHVVVLRTTATLAMTLLIMTTQAILVPARRIISALHTRVKNVTTHVRSAAELRIYNVLNVIQTQKKSKVVRVVALHTGLDRRRLVKSVTIHVANAVGRLRIIVQIVWTTHSWIVRLVNVNVHHITLELQQTHARNVMQFVRHVKIQHIIALSAITMRN